MSNNTILIVDDEIGIRELLSEILRDEGYRVAVAENAGEARSWRKQARPDLVLLDIWMPDTDGITLLKEWASSGLLTMPVVMMSGHGTIDTAVEATRMGAAGYLEKPVPLQKLLSTVGRALRGGQIRTRIPLPLASLGKSPLIVDLKKRLEQVAHLRTPVLLTSEPGCGVDLCARFLHRPNTPWVEPDTASALSNAPFDLLEQAKGGMLFLKEIGDLNKLAQKGLLLLMGKLDKYSIRLICVTSTPLPELAAQGLFDPKLYEMLSSLCINVPSLREHREDIPELAAQILSRYVESGEVPLRQFSTAALNSMRNHDWPGNLAQLTGTVHSLALTCPGEEISADDVNRILASSSSVQAVSGIPHNMPLREARDLFEKAYFEFHLAREGGSMTRVAEKTGLERTHLYRKLRQLGVDLGRGKRG